MKKLLSKIADIYLSIPLLIDGLVVVVIFQTVYRFHFFNFKLTNLEGQLNILSNIISTCISLSGFILAALTIIVTFKSNLQAKGIEQSENALEIIFSSHHYKSIVKVFKDCIMELTIAAILQYTVWALSENVPITFISNTIISSITIISLSCIRTLYILFSIIDLENYRDNDE